MNINKTHSNNLTQPLRMTSKMVENTWATIGYFLHHLDLDIRKKTRLECLHLEDFEKETIHGL